MNGVHDMGGQHGHGAVQAERDEPMFHTDWERRALGVTLAMGATGQWTIDMSRAARERIGAARYLASSYYQIWLAGLEALLVERALLTPEELRTGHAQCAAKAVARVLRAAEVDAALARGTPTARPGSTAPRFGVGDAVRARNWQPSTHTRLPGYVRGHVGTVEKVHGRHVFADTHARWTAGAAFDESACVLYTVVFSGDELWGNGAEPGLRVSVEAWEPYLEAA